MHKKLIGWGLVIILFHVRFHMVVSHMISSRVFEWQRLTSPLSHPTVLNLEADFGQRVAQVAAGRTHTLALTNNGNIFAWGDNNAGQLGDGTFVSRRIPVQINAKEMGRVIQIATAAMHSAAVTQNGRVYMWGFNSFGQLGDGTFDNKAVPTLVQSMTSVVQVAVGIAHSLALTAEGEVYTWGRLLSSGWAPSSKVPVLVEELLNQTVTGVTAGFRHSAAVTSDGVVYTWGSSDHGQLGHDNTFPSIPLPVDTTGVLKDKHIIQISAGSEYTVALSTDGRVFSWGRNSRGQLGDGTFTTQMRPVAVNVNGALPEKINITQISANGENTVTLSSDGNVYAWGSNKNGQLGFDFREAESSFPVLIQTNNSIHSVVRQCSVGEGHAVILKSNGEVYSWGDNQLGQLGIGTTINSRIPVLVHMSLSSKVITQIISSGQHYLVVTNDGMVYAWGQNSRGQLGDGSNVAKSAPVPVDMSGALQGKKIVQVGASLSASFALSSDGKVFAWGDNNGRLGDGTTRNSNVPVSVEMDGALRGKVVTQITIGELHTVVLTSDGHLYSWGANERGQLGDGTLLRRSVPVAVDINGVLKNKTITQVVAGFAHTVVATKDGLIYSWGDNMYMQQGDGTTINRNTPGVVVINATSPIKSIFASAHHTFVVTLDGVIHCWGNKKYVQLGELTGKDITHIAASDTYMFAVTNDLEMWEFTSVNYNFSQRVNITDSQPIRKFASLFADFKLHNGFLDITCEKGYYGDMCMSYSCYGVDSNDEMVCSGNGECIDVDQCKCSSQYTGINCSFPLCNEISSLDRGACSGNGECLSPNLCRCNSGYTGHYCSTNLNQLALLALLAIPLVVLVGVIVALCWHVLRRMNRDKQIESDLRACLLEEMSVFDVSDDGNFFIDMKDIKLLSRISEGACGVVFKGEWKSNLVAVKKMKVADDKSFLKEISILQNLRHPNILYLYGYSSNDNGDKFLITEFASQGSLDKVLYGKTPLRDFQKKMNIIAQVADSMAFLHSRSPRIVHRDLKPQNILLDDKNQVRICDFGLSKAVDTAFTIGVTYGTIEYCAPELLTHQEHDEKCDVYSFGILMHEMFVLSSPYSIQQGKFSLFALSMEIVNGRRPHIPFDPSNLMSDPKSIEHFFRQSNTTVHGSSVDIPLVVRDYYVLATRCWHADREKRPHFEEVTIELNKITSTMARK